MQELIKNGLETKRIQHVNVIFDTIKLEGYGPFKKSEYQLSGRGVRVITGKNEDDASTDSNGAGKTALVMAALWALTGRTASRAQVWCERHK